MAKKQIVKEKSGTRTPAAVKTAKGSLKVAPPEIPRPVAKTKPELGVAAVAVAPAPPAPVVAAAVPPGNGTHVPPDNSTPELGPIPEKELRKVKTGLTKRDLDHYRRLLLMKRAEILGDVASLQTDSLNNSGGNLSNMPDHMADVGSDSYEQEFTLGLVESERELVREIDEALARIERGIFGVCLEKGLPIGKPRLDAKPWAKHCIAVAREMERRGKAG